MTGMQQALCIALLFVTALMSLKLMKAWETNVCTN
jgi:hypothetical protein